MALTDILEKIDKEAQAQIDELQKEFEKKKKELEAEAQEMKKRTEVEMTTKAEANAAKLKEAAKLEAEMEEKNQLLRAKRTIMEEILEKTVHKLSESDNYDEILAEIMKRADIESAEVLPAKGKEEETKKAIQKSGKNYTLASESANIAGGFILRSEKIEIDNSFETIILQELRSKLEIELHKLLF